MLVVLNILTYVLYARRLTGDELGTAAKTHIYRKLTSDEFLRLLPLVNERDEHGRIIVDNAFAHRFLYRLGSTVTTVDVYRNTYDSNRVRNLRPWPLSAQEHALIIENMEFPDGQFSGQHAKGQFGLLIPKME